MKQPKKLNIVADLIILGYKNGLTLDKLAITHGVSKSTIHRHLKQYNIPRRHVGPIPTTSKMPRNPEKRKLYNNKYLSTEKGKSAHKKATLKYFKYNINAKIANSLRSRLYNSIKYNQKSGSAVRDLGCSISEFKLYLENQFQPGMTWKNYGQWEIDHVIPLSEFNLANKMEFFEACNWLNLQPLWQDDNIKKANKQSRG